MLASIVDSTARKQAEAKLLRLQREHERILNTVDFGIHGVSTSRPSPDFETRGRSLPVGSLSGSSLSTYGSALSRPSWRHSRT